MWMASGVSDSALFYSEDKGSGRRRWYGPIYLGAAARVSRNGAQAGPRGLCGAGAEPVLLQCESSHRGLIIRFLQARGSRQSDAYGDCADGGCQHQRCEGIHGLSRRSATDEQEEKDGRAGLLRGWSSDVSHGGDPARPNRAAATFHGGGLVTDKPDSPHLLILQMKAEVLCCLADNDDKRDPAAKDKLNESFTAAHVKVTVEVFEGCNHGWTVRGSQVYNEGGPERAWSELSAHANDNVWSAAGLQGKSVGEKTSLRKCIRPLGGDRLSWP